MLLSRYYGTAKTSPARNYFKNLLRRYKNNFMDRLNQLRNWITLSEESLGKKGSTQTRWTRECNTVDKQ